MKSRRFTSPSASHPFDGKDSTALLRCGISIWPMSGLGHKRPRQSEPVIGLFPLLPQKRKCQCAAAKRRFVPLADSCTAAKKHCYSITSSARDRSTPWLSSALS